MAGIFQKMVTVVNRGRVPLTVTFDGQHTEVPVGESQIPELVIPYALNQNPIMGSADPTNPSLSGARYLIGVVGRHDVTPLSDDEWQEHCLAACRMDWATLMDDRLHPGERVVIKGKKDKLQARGLSESKPLSPTMSEFATARE